MISRPTLGRLLILGALLGVFGSAQAQTSTDRIPFNGQDLWVSGANIAWVDFARDIGPGTTRLDRFAEIFQEMRSNGGNTLRLWLHTTGEVTPEWAGLEVVGPGDGAIEDLRAILDLAWQHDVSLLLCLWSHDMLDLARSTTVLDRAYGILTDEALLQTYIDNALVPMVDSLRGHPANLAWEIFNEAEGFSTEMGWSSRRRVPMSNIQRFVNRSVAAIRQTDPDVMVTTGTWRMRALSDVGSFHNYYTDERLVAAGGEEDGTLDFYTVHYYQDFGTAESPFVHDYSYWELDKPLVIAEFFTNTTSGIPHSDLYRTLFDRGYAGALGWQWFNYPTGGEGATHWPRILENTRWMSDEHPEAVALIYEGLRMAFSADPDAIEAGSESVLRWSVRGADEVMLDGQPVEAADTLVVMPMETTTYRLEAAAADTTGVLEVTVSVVDPDQVNRARGREAIASSNEGDNEQVADPQDDPQAVTDGDINTRWSSSWRDDEWIYVDLGKAFDIHRVVLEWEAAYASEYDLDLSFDARTWTTIHAERAGDGQTDEILLEEHPPARFVRMHGLTRATEWGFSLFEFEVYGLVADPQPPIVTLASPQPGEYDLGALLTLRANLEEGAEIAYVLFLVDGDSVGAATAEPYELQWNPEATGSYALRAVAYDSHGRGGVSAPVEIAVVVPRQRVRYESDVATFTGQVQKLTVAGASGGSVLEMRDSGTITWSDIEIVQGGLFDLIIGYRLNFDTPKGQNLYVNGTEIDEIMFDGAVNEWLTRETPISLVAGSNTISLVKSWGWMQFDYIEIVGNGQAVSAEDVAPIPTEFALGSNYPNPFNPSTVIPFQVPQPMHIRIDVFDVTGRRVATLVDGVVQAGRHTATFDAGTLASGVYLYRLVAGTNVQSRRMVVVK